MEAVHQQFTLQAHTARLAELRQFVHRVCVEQRVNRDVATRLVLAVDEATANVIEHSNTPPDVPIEVTMGISDSEVVVKIRDHGEQFNPEKLTGRNSTANTSHAKRGFGLYLIHLIADDIRYERTEQGENVLTLMVENELAITSAEA